MSAYTFRGRSQEIKIEGSVHVKRAENISMTKHTIVEYHHGPYQSTQRVSSYNLTSKYRFRVRVHISTLFYEKDFVFQTCGVDDSIDA